MARYIAFFAFWGPVLASFSVSLLLGVWAAAMATQEVTLGEAVSAYFLGAFVVGILGLFIAVPLGIVPAMAAGLGYWAILRYFTSTNPRWPARLMLGASLGLVISMLYGYLYALAHEGSNSDGIVFLLSCSGFFAGALCALFVTRRFYCRSFEGRCPDET